MQHTRMLSALRMRTRQAMPRRFGARHAALLRQCALSLSSSSSSSSSSLLSSLSSSSSRRMSSGAADTTTTTGTDVTPQAMPKQRTKKKIDPKDGLKSTRFRPQKIRGMRDIFAPDSTHMQQVLALCRSVVETYEYVPVQTPVIEALNVYQSSLGDDSEVMNHQLYEFQDGARSVTLRPEGTAGTIRALVNSGALHRSNRRSSHRLYYHGSMFRRERQQRGRFREFTQFGVECVGGDSGSDVDVECIAMAAHMLKRLGLLDKVTLQINTLGTAACRAAFEEALTRHLQPLVEGLSQGSQRRLANSGDDDDDDGGGGGGGDANKSGGVMRVLDSKHPDDIRTLDGEADKLPRLGDFVSPECGAHFRAVQRGLTQLGIQYEVNDRLVRGLSYYCSTAFEFVADAHNGAQATVLAGGRYDGLVERLGGPKVGGIGWAAGVDRLMLERDRYVLPPLVPTPPIVAVVKVPMSDDAAATAAMAAADGDDAVAHEESTHCFAATVAHTLRDNGLAVRYTRTERPLHKQLQQLDDDVAVVVLIGLTEVTTNQVAVKRLSHQRVYTPGAKQLYFNCPRVPLRTVTDFVTRTLTVDEASARPSWWGTDSFGAEEVHAQQCQSVADSMVTCFGKRKNE